MNDAGQITGFSQAPDQSEHAFLYSHGSMTDLGTLGGNYSYGLAVNNRRARHRICAFSQFEAHAFLYRGGVMHDPRHALRLDQ